MTDDRWQDAARRFANPAFMPEWSPPDRPSWPYAANVTFRAWVVARLNELAPADGSAGLLRSARVEELQAGVPAVAEALHAAFGRIDLARVGRRYALKAMQMTKGGRAPTLDAVERATLNDMEAMTTGQRRRGPARGADPDAERRATIRAAWDVWLIRTVLVPRFWPERRGGQVHLPGGEAEYKRIIAQRYAVHRDPKKLAQGAWAEYRKSRMAND
ncbi:hypothetical protein [uncultured Sphingomonas sp.]|uniref:hypothetical protein n=1 Tax=uncultured Sphingomonas sp. TaxID=158754 RepID=UPI0025F49AB1|nr:hypothetical protein [uncultured Sphingomonas sp.]